MRTIGIVSLLSIGCLRFADDPMRVSDAASTVTVTDTSVVVDVFIEDAGDTSLGDSVRVDTAPADVGPTMCSRFGGFPALQTAMTGLVPRLFADCRLEPFFRGIDASRLSHMTDCMGRQLASVMACAAPDGTKMKYPTLDSKGAQCRDMFNAHKTAGADGQAFDAMIDQLAAVLSGAGMAAADLALVTDVVRSTKKDVASVADAGRSDACVPEASTAADAP